MSRKIQQSLFDQRGKRGRKPKKPLGHFGGIYLKNYNPKSVRPMDSKKALHLVLKSSQAVGERSFGSDKLKTKIWDIICDHAEQKDITIYNYANGGNHLHLLLRAKNRDDYNAFIRSITGLIARLVGNSEKGKPLKKKFWDARPFSRVVSFAKKEFNNIKAYLLRNILEAIGWIPYITRDRRLPKELRQLLDAGIASSA
jgi:REP element-mobilizing transposase RayT